MLSKEIHINEINRFHSELEKLSNQINEAINNKDDLLSQKLSIKYFHLSNLQMELDNFIEMKLKHKLDIILNK